MIDLHSHVLPGIDDGPATIEGAVAIARGAIASGTSTLLATPHVSARYPNDAATIARTLAELVDRLEQEGIALELRAGAEIALTRLAEMDPSELGQLSLGGGPWLLIEPPFAPVASPIEAGVRELLGRGHRVLLAHPERCPAIQRDPAILRTLVQEGVLSSITAGSLVGRFGGEVRRFALELLEAGMVHNVSSDAHDALRRPPSIAHELAAAGFEPLREWLTWAVPTAILDGGEIPPRPAFELPAQPQRRWPWARNRSR